MWLDLLRHAECQVDVLAYAALFLPELDPGLVQTLQAKADAGATVRIALGDPRAPALRCRGEEEGIGEGMAARAAMTLRHFAPQVGRDGIDVRVHDTTLYNSIFRFDDDMLVNTHVFGAMAYRNPVLHLRNTGPEAMFAAYATSFERVWAMAAPYRSYVN